MANDGVSIEEALAHDPNAEPVAIADDYMGLPVTATSIKITKAGDGLSKQMEIDARVLVPGQRYRVLLEGVAGDHTHKLIPKAESWELVQVLEAEAATFVDDKASESKMRVARDRVAKEADKKKGRERLPGTDASDLEGTDGKSAAAGERPDWGPDSHDGDDDEES